MEKRVYLPEDIISQIITSSELDLKSIIKCMAVCKLWRNLVSDLISNNPHLGAKGQFLVYDNTQCRFGALDDETKQIAWMYSAPHQTQNAYIMPSCNGMVCFHPAYNGKNIDICNPLTGERISIPYPGRQGHILQYNLWFCPSNNEYKLTCLSECTLETYTLGSPGGWRSVPFDLVKVRIHKRGPICINGVLHWLLRTQSILTFDLATEVLGSIPLPHLEDDKEIYQLECMDHCLVVTAYNLLLGLEIWVRKEDESSGESVWAKNWVIDAAQPLLQITLRWLVPQKLSTDGLIIMRDYGYGLYSYDSRNKLVRLLWACGDNRRLLSYYMPTLISPEKLMQKNGQEWSEIENKERK